MLKLLYNKKASAALANLSVGGRLPHAILFEGPQGCGKKLAADIAAQYALCEGEQKPCGVCSQCVKVERHTHPDLRYFTVPAGKKEFPIDLVRQLRQEAYIAPNEGCCKVYVIDQAHAMNASAQNALLKIIEEPPAHARFILLCENRSMMLPTILSRVTAIELELPTVEQCAQALASLRPQNSPEERQAAASGAGGNIGRALSLLETGKPARAMADAKKLCELLIFADRYQPLEILAGYDKDREGLLAMLPLLKGMFAQIAVSHYAKTGRDERVCNRVTPAQALDAAQAVEAAVRQAGQNVNIPLLCALMVERAKQALH